MAELFFIDDLPHLRGRSAALAAIETELQACAETSDLAARVREIRVLAGRNETETLASERERTEGALRMVAQLEARLRAVCPTCGREIAANGPQVPANVAGATGTGIGQENAPAGRVGDLARGGR